MKKVISLASLILVSLILSSCKITQESLWGSKSYEESFGSFFIDEKNRVLLIGENKEIFKEKGSYHYIVDGDVEEVVREFMTKEKYRYVRDNLNCPTEFSNLRIKNIFEIGARIGKMELSLSYPEAKGDRIFVRSMGMVFDKKDLSGDEIKFLRKSGFKETKNEKKFYQNCPIYLYRHFSSREAVQNRKLIPINSGKNEQIWERDTPSQTFGKILLTPFAVAADIILAPVYLVTAITIGALNHHANHTSDAKK